MNKKVCIVIPVCNEQDNVGRIVTEIHHVMRPLPYEYSITFVDDGSDDETMDTIRELSREQSNLFFISFSRNFGHQNALKAGIDRSQGDCVLCLDGDLQHPPALFRQMIRLWEQGNDIVYTIRKDHQERPGLKRRSSNLFYGIINRLSDIEIENGTADFRLLDKRVVEVMRNLKEYELFWRGLVKWMGFQQVSLEYEPRNRVAGASKYTYKKMMQFALHGITSFSTKPLTMAMYMGFACSMLSLLYVPYIFFSLFVGKAISGWASLLATIVFFGGIQLIILGIIGLYLGKIFIQCKQRPHYIIKETNLPCIGTYC